MKTVRFLFCFGILLIFIPSLIFADDGQWNDEDFAHLSNSVGFQIFKELAKTEKGSICISPYALTTSLLQIYIGGSEEQRENLKEVFSFHQEDEVLLTMRKKVGRSFDIAMTNPIFLESKVTLPKDLNSLLKKEFDEYPQYIDFSGKQTVRVAINRFIDKRINTFNEDFFPRKDNPFESVTPPLLISATSSQTEWGIFYATSRERFGNRKESDGKRRPLVSMATARGDFHIRDFKGFIVITKEYGHIQSVIILPDKNVPLASVLDKINASNIKSLFSRKVLYYCQITIPEFKLYFRTSLKDAINALGAKSLFKTSDIDEPPLALSDFLVFAFNQYYMSPPKDDVLLPSKKPDLYISVDRPFIYFKRDIKTGALLFLGRFQPTEND